MIPVQRKEINPVIEVSTKALEEAEKQNNPLRVADCVKDLGIAFLERQQWTFAAKIFNAALALYQKENQSSPEILSQMAKVETFFLQKECGIQQPPIDPQNYLQRRQTLQKIRKVMMHQMEENQPIPDILEEFSRRMGHLLAEILKSGYSIFGPLPCDFTFLGLGSVARQEMSPYSDLEFALLIEESTPKNLEYFRKLVQWLELQVIHLGETPIRILDRGHESPVIRGFCFDDGGNTPLGKQGYVELIKTPKDLAQFQSEKFYIEDLILSNTLRGASIMVGSELLFKKYQEAIQNILSGLYQQRALNLLRGHLIEFEPCIDRKKEETPIYNIKAELYRLPNFLIAGLADYYQIEEQNTWKRIDALAKREILSLQGAEHLKEAFTKIMNLRIRCHLHYGRECDEVYHPSMQLKSVKQLDRVFILSNADIEKIIEIYRVIFPLHRSFKQVCQTGNFKDLSKETFYDTSLAAQGEAFEKLYQYGAAKKCYFQVVALNPHNGEALLNFALFLLRKLAEYPEAQEYASKALAVGTLQKNEEIVARAEMLQGFIRYDLGDAEGAIKLHAKTLEFYKKKQGSNDLALCHNNLGMAWQALGNTKKAIEHFEEVLKISKTICDNFTVGIALNNLGIAWQSLGDVKKGIEYFEDALKIGEKIYGEEHYNIFSVLNNLGAAWRELEEAKKAIGYLEEAVRIGKKIYGDEHPDVGTALNNLGSLWWVLGDAKKAIEYHEKALAIGKKVYGDEHPNLGICLNNLGGAWWVLGDAKKGISYFEEALRISIKVHGDQHRDVAQLLNHLGRAWIDLDARKAIRYLEEALEIGKKVYSNDHPEMARCLANLGMAYKSLGDAKQAIEYNEEALRIAKKVYGNEHPDVARCLTNLGDAWCSLKDPKKAMRYHEEAHRIYKKNYGDQHPEMARCLNNLGMTWRDIDAKKSIGYLEKGLKICKKVYGDLHPEVAKYLHNLGLVWEDLGDVKKAIEYFEESLRIGKKVYGDEHPLLATILSDLGHAWNSLNDTKKAMGFLEEALKICRKTYGNEHPQVAGFLNNLGMAWKALGKSNRAIVYLEEALTIGKKVYGNEHPDVAIVLNNLGETWYDLQDVKKAIDCYEEAVMISKKVYGNEHPVVITYLDNLAIATNEIADEKALLLPYEEPSSSDCSNCCTLL